VQPASLEIEGEGAQLGLRLAQRTKDRRGGTQGAASPLLAQPPPFVERSSGKSSPAYRRMAFNWAHMLGLATVVTNRAKANQALGRIGSLVVASRIQERRHESATPQRSRR